MNWVGLATQEGGGGRGRGSYYSSLTHHCFKTGNCPSANMSSLWADLMAGSCALDLYGLCLATTCSTHYYYNRNF